MSYIVVNCIIEIKRLANGEKRMMEKDFIRHNDDIIPDIFIWEEGNNSCDCNRHLYFKRINNEEITKRDREAECTDGKYLVNIKDKETKELYLKEF